ncbi:MAG TPA: hypothetical protein EYO58_07995, partial [Flavobacteriales bacterium]|nr:hypothetical protein [Flavobacteriales bacterium]
MKGVDMSALRPTKLSLPRISHMSPPPQRTTAATAAEPTRSIFKCIEPISPRIATDRVSDRLATPSRHILNRKVQFKFAPRDSSSAINDFKISLDTLLHMSSQQIHLLSHDDMRHILRVVFKSSWEKAKHHLATSDNANHILLMRKLIAVRALDCNTLLKETQSIINRIYGPKGLTTWSHSGASELTSDIDINLKGLNTEYAVEVFNYLFREEWGFEAGTVYDLNAYALDFIHGLSYTSSYICRAKREYDIKDHLLIRKNNKRQLEWAMVKLRLRMTPTQWDTFRL